MILCEIKIRTMCTHFFIYKNNFFGAMLGVLKFSSGFIIVQIRNVLSDFGLIIVVLKLLFFLKKSKKKSLFFGPQTEMCSFENLN